LLNQTKMFLYRMIKSKSFYVVLILHFIWSLLTIYVASRSWGFSEKQTSVSFSGLLYAYGGVGTYGMLMAMFATISTCADFTSGYIKNIAGRTRMRWHFIGAKTLAVFCYTIVSFAFFCISTEFWCLVYDVKATWDSNTELYALTIYVSSLCAALMGILIGELFRRMGSSIALTIILGNGLFSSLLTAFTSIAMDFQIGKYMPVGALLSMKEPTSTGFEGSAEWVIGVSLVYMVIFFGLSAFDFSRRDAV